MRKSLCISLFVILSGSLAAQTKNARTWNVPKMVFEGRPARILLAPHVTTTIRLPEPVNSVIVGEPNLFQAEIFTERAASCVCEGDRDECCTNESRNFDRAGAAVCVSFKDPQRF